jgi:hypothetical protein
LEDEDVEIVFVAVSKSASNVSDPFDYDCQLRFGAGRWWGKRTEASNGEGDELVGPASPGLDDVHRSRREEADDEDDCCNKRWSISVKFQRRSKVRGRGRGQRLQNPILSYPGVPLG